MPKKLVTTFIAAGMLGLSASTAPADTVLSGDWFVDFPRNEKSLATSSFDGSLRKDTIKTKKGKNKKPASKKQ